MTDIEMQRLHAKAAQAHIEAGRLADGDEDYAIAAFEEAQEASQKAGTTPFLDGLIQIAKDAPAGGDGRHDGEAAEASYQVALGHLLAAFPDNGHDPFEDGWQVEVWRQDFSSGNPWADATPPDDPDHAKRAIEAAGLRFNETQSHGDGYFDIVVGLPTDIAQIIRRTGVLYIPFKFEDEEWHIHAELDPR